MFIYTKKNKKKALKSIFFRFICQLLKIIVYLHR